MPLEKRGRRIYYYKATWVNGRSVRQYVAKGDSAHLMAFLAYCSQERKEELRQALRRYRKRLAQTDAVFIHEMGVLLQLARALIQIQGYHRPGRGRWRKKRRGQAQEEQIPAEVAQRQVCQALPRATSNQLRADSCPEELTMSLEESTDSITGKQEALTGHQPPTPPTSDARQSKPAAAGEQQELTAPGGLAGVISKLPEVDKARQPLVQGALVKTLHTDLPADWESRKQLFDRIFEKGATFEDFALAAQLLVETPELAPTARMQRLRGALTGGVSCVAARVESDIFQYDTVMRDLIEAAAQREVLELAGGPEAPLAIRLLAQRVVACKYHLGTLEEEYFRVTATEAAAPLLEGKTLNGKPIPRIPADVRQLEKRLERLQNMYLAALKALREAQQLRLPPVVQISAPTASVTMFVGED